MARRFGRSFFSFVAAFTSACGPPQSPAVVEGTPKTIERQIEPALPTRDFGMSAYLSPQKSPDTTARAVVLELAVRDIRDSRVGICLLTIAYRARSVSVAVEPSGPLQIWIDGTDAWHALMTCTGAGMTRHDTAVPYTNVDGRSIVGNVALKRLAQDSIWAGIPIDAEIKAGERGPSRTALPDRPVGIPADAVAWLHMDESDSAARISWPGSAALWLTRDASRWRVTLRFVAHDDLAWQIRDRAKALRGELSARFPAPDVLDVVRSDGAAGVEATLSNDSLDVAWALLLDVARTGRLPPVEPMIQQTAANTYVVRISDLRRWQLFDWVDVALTKQRDGVRVATVKGLPFVSLERSPLPSLGVRYGDLILRINSTKIRTPTDIEHAVLAAIEQGLPAIEVEIRRGWTVATVALRYELVP